MSGLKQQQYRKIGDRSLTNGGFLSRLRTSRLTLPIMFLVVILVMIPIISFVIQNGLHAKYTAIPNNSSTNATSTYTIDSPSDIVNEQGAKLIFPDRHKYSNYIGAGTRGEVSYLGLRFTHGVIPLYARIVTVYIMLTTTDLLSVHVQTTVAVEKNTDAQSFSNISRPSARYTNLATTVTDYSDTPPETKDARFNIDVTRQVQELMNIPGRLASMPISFLFKASGENGHRHFYNSQTPDKAPRLIVTYSKSPSQQAPFALTVTSKQISTTVTTPVASTELDTMVKQTLDDITQYGWDSTTQGVHINWYRNNPSVPQNPHHDGQNDLRDYEVMVWYEARHPGDTSQQAAIARLLPTIKVEWGRSTLPKGWIYFLFQRLVQYSGNAGYWTNTMENWAATVYRGIDPAMGVPHGPVKDSTAANAPTCPDGYRVDQNIENGLALIDAGKRFGNQAWMQAGAREVSIIMQQAFVSKYHFFARIVCQGKIWNWEAKAGEYGQEIDALLKVGVYTNNQTYLSVAEQMLDEVTNPSTGLRDLQHGGIYYKFLLDTGSVDTSRKEMRQFAVLQALHEANAIFHNRYASFEADMIRAVKSSFFAPPVAGWMYELNPNWTLYKGTENWISVEASGMAMEAIQTILS